MSERLETIKMKAAVIGDETDVRDEILPLAGDAQFVLIGEASHGTQEFYKYRAGITKRLIEEKQFSAVAVEADFPDAYRVNRFVRGGADSKDKTANDALSDFTRFPLWMRRNADVLEFVEWLKSHNDKLELNERVGFYGIDLYSLHASIEAVLGYLEELFYETGIENFFLNLQDEKTKDALKLPLLERAIGVIYRPETERVSHYSYADLPDRFDGAIHFDATRVVQPLDKVSSRTHKDVPETFPEGI